MKKVIFTIFFIIPFGMFSQTPNVSYEYDNDGNMKLRKAITITPSYVKNQQKNETIFEDNIGNQKVVLYPNPTYGVFQLSITELNKKEVNLYCLYSLNGALLLKTMINSSLTEVDITRFSAGTYLIDIYLGERVSRWKVIKK